MAKRKAKRKSGADYVAVVELTRKSGELLVAAGGTCDDIPASSLDWLLDCGAIEPKPKKKPAKSARGKKR